MGSEGLVAGQVVDIKSEGKGEVVGLETLQVGPPGGQGCRRALQEHCRAG